MSMRTSRASKPARKLLGALGVLSALLLASTVCTGMVFWTENGVEIRGTGLTGNAQNVQTVTDGAGGAFITWQDSRAGQTDNFAQRVDSSGSPQWAANGIDVGGTGNQSSHPLASDGSGGMIVTWEEYRSSDTQIYAQRLNSSGDPQWVADGLNIKPPKFSSNFAYPSVTEDISGGAIFAWPEYLPGSMLYGIYVQKVNNSGELQWNSDGIEIRGTSLPGDARGVVLTSDGSGGAIITWSDNRSGKYDIFAQRVDSSGNILWTPDGVEIRGTGLVNDVSTPNIVPSASGGAIIAWSDKRSGRYDVYAQRVDASGTPQWTVNGLKVRGEGFSSVAGSPALCPDGSGGAIINWVDYRNDPSEIGLSDIFAQRLDSSGASLWITGGIAIRTGPSLTSYPKVTSDGSGAAIITWNDRSGSNYTDYAIYAQKVDSSGTPLWAANGEVVRSSSVTDRADWAAIATAAPGGAIIAWQDWRAGKSDIYAQRVADPPVIPHVASISPKSAANVAAVSVAITGENFAPGASAKLLKDTTEIGATSVTVVSENTITCKFNLSGKPLGKYDVIVENPDGQKGTLTGGFTVTNACGQSAALAVSLFAGLLGLLTAAGLGWRRQKR